jgi:hypothetical protein
VHLATVARSTLLQLRQRVAWGKGGHGEATPAALLTSHVSRGSPPRQSIRGWFSLGVRCELRLKHAELREIQRYRRGQHVGGGSTREPERHQSPHLRHGDMEEEARIANAVHPLEGVEVRVVDAVGCAWPECQVEARDAQVVDEGRLTGHEAKHGIGRSAYPPHIGCTDRWVS